MRGPWSHGTGCSDGRGVSGNRVWICMVLHELWVGNLWQLFLADTISWLGYLFEHFDQNPLPPSQPPFVQVGFLDISGQRIELDRTIHAWISLGVKRLRRLHKKCSSNSSSLRTCSVTFTLRPPWKFRAFRRGKFELFTGAEQMLKHPLDTDRSTDGHRPRSLRSGSEYKYV